MNLLVPQIEEGACAIFTACGNVQASGKGKLVKSSFKNWQIAEVPDTKVREWIRLAYSTSSRHLHIDLATGTFFPENEPPKSNIAFKGLLKKLDQFEGVKLNTTAGADFKARLVDIPESSMIRKTMLKAREGGVSVKLTGARLSFEGLPIEAIYWREDDISKSIKIEVRTIEFKNRVFTSAYLVDLYKEVKDLYRLLAFGETING